MFFQCVFLFHYLDIYAIVILCVNRFLSTMGNCLHICVYFKVRKYKRLQKVLAKKIEEYDKYILQATGKRKCIEERLRTTPPDRRKRLTDMMLGLSEQIQIYTEFCERVNKLQLLIEQVVVHMNMELCVPNNVLKNMRDMVARTMRSREETKILLDDIQVEMSANGPSEDEVQKEFDDMMQEMKVKNLEIFLANHAPTPPENIPSFIVAEPAQKSSTLPIILESH